MFRHRAKIIFLAAFLWLVRSSKKRARAKALKAAQRATARKERLALAASAYDVTKTDERKAGDPTAPLVLVTGGTGYVGSHCVRKLLEDGFRVRATVRDVKSSKSRALKQCTAHAGQVELVEADLTVADGWDAAVAGCTYVLHVAAPVETTDFCTDSDSRHLRHDERSEKAHRAAVEGTIVVIEAAKKAGVKRLVLTSSLITMTPKGWVSPWHPESGKAGEWDGDRDWTKFVGNHEIWTDENVTDGYPLAKTRAERAAWEAVKGSSLELSAINPGIIWGPQLHPLLCSTSLNFIDSAMGENLDPNRAVAAWPCAYGHAVDVRDVATAHVKAMLLPAAANQRYPMSSACRPVAEYAQILGRKFKPMGYECVTGQAPYWFIRSLALVDPLLARMSRVWGKYVKYDCQKTLTELQLNEWIDVEKTLCDTVDANVALGFYERLPGYVSEKC